MTEPKAWLFLKTLEFKLYLNKTQEQAVERWLDVQRWVWNQGLAYLKEFEAFSHYNKHDKAHAPCCPVPWEYRWIPVDSDREWRDSAIVGSYAHKWRPLPMPLITEKFAGQRNTNPSQCPLLQAIFEADNPSSKATLTQKVDAGEIIRTWPEPQLYREPKLDRDSEYSLTPLFAKKLNQDKSWLIECPYKLTQGTIKLLATSWAEYRKGKRKSPRFKRCGENRTLNDTQSGQAQVEGGYIKLPKIGRTRVRSLEKRWPAGLPVKSYRIMKRPSGYYLLLVGELASKPVKTSTKVAGFDAGVVHILNDDVGHHTDIPLPLKRRLKTLKRLQRQASRQQKGSANQKKTYAKITKLHEKVGRDRKAWHHKLSTFAVRKYGGIAVEDLKLANMTRRPKAKPKADGSGYERNMAAAKAGLNRALLDASFGQLFSMIEAKSKAHGRAFVRVPPQYTSQTCNECGVVHKASRLSQSEFVCTDCGHTTNADTNAARNIRDTAFPEFRGSYPAWAGEVKPASDPSMGCQQEAISVALSNDVAPIPTPPREGMGVTEEKAPKPLNSVARKSTKRRSAQIDAATPIQLGLWDAAPETG